MGRDTKKRHHGKSGPPSGWFGWTCLSLAHPSQASHEVTIQISYSSCGCVGSQIGWLEATSTNANLILVLICLAVTLVALTRPREPRRPPNLIPPCAPPCPTGTPPARYHDDPRQTPLLGGCAITALAVVAAHPLTQCMLSFVVSAFARLAVTARFSITRSIPTRG